MTTAMTDIKPITILIVEDDEVDMMSVRRVLRGLKIANPKVHVKDGVEALNFMTGRAGFEKITTEVLVLLDLNMPRVNGLEFLDALKSESNLPPHSIYVLTTSDADTDIVQAHKRDIAGYVLKSHLKEGLAEIFKNLRSNYWSVLGARI